MRDKDSILAEVQEALRTGTVTRADIQTLVADQAEPVESSKLQQKVSAVDVMFYIAGIILYSAIVSTIAQTWADGNALMHILLSAGVGVGLWVVAYLLIKSPTKSDIRDGLINALLLTGSLSVITGGYIITNEFVGGYGPTIFIPTALMLLVVSALHLVFDSMIKRDLTLLMGTLLGVAAFPVFMAGILQNAEVTVDVWSVVWILTAGLMAVATRVIARLMPSRQRLQHALDSLAVFVALAAMYISSYGDYALMWLLLLVAGVLSIFYLSIITQKKELLGNASFFLVITVITISFKYFSGYGITTSLVLATIGLLGSAAVASMINKKYFK